MSFFRVFWSETEGDIDNRTSSRALDNFHFRQMADPDYYSPKKTEDACMFSFLNFSENDDMSGFPEEC